MSDLTSSTPDHFPQPTDSMQASAREWVIRHDRGLTPAETEAFHRWLAENALHGVAWEENSTLLSRMDRLTISRAVAGGPRAKPVWWRWAPALAAAAVVAVAAVVIQSGRQPAAVPATRAAPGEKGIRSVPAGNPAPMALPAQRGVGAGGLAMGSLTEAGTVQRLSDGSVVYLRPGAEFHERFSGKYRGVNLVSGEAMFDVAASGDDRLFVVTAGVYGTDGAVAITTHNSWFAVSVVDGVVETKVVTGQAMVVPAQTVVIASRNGSEPIGMLTDAGLTTKIDYPSTADSVAHVMPLRSSDLQQLLGWKRSVEAFGLPAAASAK